MNPEIKDLTLRDWFATQASEEDIQDMMLGEKDYRNIRHQEYSRQQARYRHADEMMRLKEKHENNS